MAIKAQTEITISDLKVQKKNRQQSNNLSAVNMSSDTFNTVFWSLQYPRSKETHLHGYKSWKHDSELNIVTNSVFNFG